MSYLMLDPNTYPRAQLKYRFFGLIVFDMSIYAMLVLRDFKWICTYIFRSWIKIAQLNAVSTADMAVYIAQLTI